MDIEPRTGNREPRTIMHNILKKNSLFLLTYVVLLIAGLLPVMVYPKADVHLFINHFHSEFWDVFFKYITNLGSGFTAVMVCIIFLFIRIRYSMIMLASWASAGMVVQFLKHVVFPDLDRPVKFFRSLVELNLVQGVELYDRFSFPSGHAATAFAIFTLLAMISKHNWVKLILLGSAWIVAFSRIYLSQHFLEDILFGSSLGILTGFIFYWYFHRVKIPWANESVQYHFRPAKQ